MIILDTITMKKIHNTHLLLFYNVDLEHQQYDSNAVWRYTLKTFADLALPALAL